jgi:C1A family cysteine protease
MDFIFNYVKQPEDTRDYIYQPQNLQLSQSHYLTDVQMTPCPVLNQGNLGSCVAQSAYALLYIMSKGKISLSRLQLYMCLRASDNSSLTKDTGGTIRGVMKAISNYGVCNENLWNYDVTKFDKLAPKLAFSNTYNIYNFVYTFVIQDYIHIKEVLVSGNPIICGIAVYESFQSPNSNKYGVIPIPNTKKEKLLGGHAILLIGYDDNSKTFKFQNSWGTNWGDKGFGYIPYDYIISTKLCFDLCKVSFNL